MKKYNLLGTVTRGGRYTPNERKYGRLLRDPNGHDIDITADLVDGRDGALGDVPQNQQSGDVQMQAPPGTEPAHGKAVPANQVEQQNKPEPTLRDQLSSAFKADGKPVDQANGDTVPPAAAPALTKDGEGKYRQPDGTFASAEQITAFEAAQAAPAQQGQQATNYENVVRGFTATEVQQFQSLPAELQQLVGRTMEDLNTRAERYGEYDAIEQHILGPRREALAANGSSPLVALNQLFALSDFASTKPGDFVLYFAQQNGIDLDELLDARDAAQSNGGQVDPTVAALQGQVHQLTSTITNFTQGQQQQQHEHRLQEVRDFSAAVDGANKPLRPYITEVANEWGQQIQALRTANPQMPNAEVLQKAYDNACWLNPAVRGKLQAAADATRQGKAAERARVAANAGASITGAPSGDGTTVPNNANRSLRDELMANFAAASA